MKSTHAISREIVAAPVHLLIAGAPIVAVLAVGFWHFAGRWHDPWSDLPLQPGGGVGALLMIAGSAVIHELLRVLGWMALTSARWNDVSLVFTWRGLGIAALLRAPVSMRAFRTATLFPAIVLGLLPLSLALVRGFGLTFLWGSFFFFECITDFALLAATRAIPATEEVRSHPTALGCIVEGRTSNRPPASLPLASHDGSNS